jgi:hypothetical protein
VASVAAAVTVQLLSHQEAAKKEIDLQVEMKVPLELGKRGCRLLLLHVTTSGFNPPVFGE